MSIDMSQFHQVFFDETDEHLATMEGVLLAVDVSAPDSEDLNAIFRAAHSIKGGAATFGFGDLAALTHILENLLDKVRKGTMPLSIGMVDVCLQAKDVLAAMLAAHRGAPAVDPSSISAVEQQLTALVSSDAAAAAKPAGAAVSPAARTSQEPAASSTMYIELDHLPEPDYNALLQSMALLGEMNLVQQGSDDPPQPWVLELTSTLQADEVAESLAFSIAPGHFRITVDHGQQDEGDFGLFLSASVGLPVQASGADVAFEEDGFGLFAPPAPVIATPTEGDDGFGLFEPLPDATTTQIVAHEDDGFGLFAPLGTAESAPAMLHEEEGFGLFAPLPAPSPAQAAPPQPVAPVAAPRAERVQPAAENSIRVNTDKVDLLLNLVGELVITQSMLSQSGESLDPVQHERLLGGILALQRNARELQEAVMSIRMTPISFVFNRFPRVVRDLASKLGKQIELKMVGENTELDKGFIEKLADPLTHLVRNSLDHGVESPEVRVAKGKSATGRLTLRAFHQGGSIVIEVTDDGAGLNRARILSKARERGMTVSDAMSDSEVWGLIFEAGFSTAAEVTDVSGRGVGMDVVKRNIQSMGGRIEIDSLADFGTTISIRLPLTLAIMDGMSVRSGDDVYVIPLSFVLESLQPQAADLKTIAGKGQVVNVRGQYLPIVSLAGFFPSDSGQVTTDPTRAILVIVEAGGQQLALQVDELIGQQQFVVKNLESNYRKVEGVAGATIMGDGRVALILDISIIARHKQRQAARLMASDPA